MRRVAVIICRVLGPIEVIVDGASAPAELLWRKHLGLLVYLARSPKRARTREHLCGLLWADKSESAARHSLNEALRVLRRCGGDEGFDTAGGQVRLLADTVRLDADTLDALIAAGSWSQAAELVAGEFLEGFSISGAEGFEHWLSSERRHWTGRSLSALLGWSSELLRQGRAAPALDAARRAETLEPTSNAAARGIMEALAGMGDRAAALAHVEGFAHRLHESGISVAPETSELAERLRRSRVGTRPPAAQPAQREHRRAPLVGRTRELGELLDHWDRARTGQGASAIVLEGEPGTGKTRLIDELASRALLSGATVALVRSVEGDLDDEASAILGLGRGGLLDAPGLPAATPEALAGFAAHLPEWAERFRNAGGATPTPLARAFPAVIAAAVAEGPLLLAIDDVQWADHASLLGLLALLRDLPRAPLCVLFAATPHPRREELDELRRKLGGAIPGLTIPVSPLGGDAVRQLAAWALPEYDAVALERVSRRVTSDSAGIPFLAVELLAAVAQGLDLREGGAAWPAPSHTLTQTLPADLPDTVVAALRIGFRRLSEDARQVLGAAAVLGGRTTGALLVRATDLPIARVDAALDELEWQRWLEVDGQGYGFVATVARLVVARDMMTRGQQARVRQRSGLLPTPASPDA